MTRRLHDKRSSGNKTRPMASADRKVNVHLVDVLFIYLSPVPVNGVAYVNSVYNVVQNVNEEAQYDNQQDPRHHSNKVCIISKMNGNF